MTRLRQMMLEELERWNYSQGTIRCYMRAVAFARYFHRSPDQLHPEHVRQYQAYLFRERKLQATSVTQRLAALRFFFLKTLKQRWGMEETPYPKKVRRLPTILSQEEVARLIDSAPTPFYRVLTIPMSIASFLPEDFPPTTPAGSRPIPASFFPARSWLGSFATSSWTLCNRLSPRANWVSTAS